MPKKAFRAFNIVHEGENLKFAPGDDVPDEIVEKVEPLIFQPREEEELFTDGNANTELVGTPPHAQSIKEGEEDISDQYSKLKLQDLIQMATDRGLEVPDNPRKATLMEILRKDDAS